MIFSSLSSASFFAQSLGPYAPRIAEMVGRATGAGMATIAAHYGQPGDQKWDDAQFLADLVGSLVLNSIVGTDMGGGINPQWFNDAADLGTFVSWHWFVDNVIPKLQEWEEDQEK